MERLIKENAAYILLVVLALIGGVYFNINKFNDTMNNYHDITAKKDELTTKQAKFEQIKQSQVKREEKHVAKSGKVIYEVLGQQFSPEASFGIMFENLLTTMTNSGVRIRSINYNYQPADDKILAANIPGYNACELSFVTVSTYTQLQNLFKNITKESYLSTIAEVFIEPYDKDKNILISKFKVRLYTKTI